MLYSSFRLGDRANVAGIAASEASTTMRLVSSFARRYLGRAQPVAVREGSSRYAFFRGTAEGVVFLSALPGYLGVGGLHIMRLTAEGSGQRNRLIVHYKVFDPEPTEKDQRDWHESVLIDDLQTVRFEFFGESHASGARRWHDEWRRNRRLPELVRIEINSLASGRWPDLIIDMRVDQRLGSGPLNRFPPIRSIDSVL